MVINSDSNNHIDIRPLKNPSDGDVRGISSKVISIKNEIDRIRDRLVSAIKIISTASLVEGEDSEEFLSSYENYSILGREITKFGLKDEKYPRTIEEFSTNPIRCWMELITISFVALHSFPDNSMIICDVIGDVKNKEDNNKNENGKEIGVCFSLIITLESYDWKQHSVKLFIPCNDDKMQTLLIVDDEIRMFC